MPSKEFVKDTATSGSTSMGEKIEIVIAPPYNQPAECHEDVTGDCSIAMVPFRNLKEVETESSKEEEIMPLLKNSESSSNESETRNRHSTLYWAALKGDWETAENIYKEHGNDITAKISKEGNTALHIAAAARHTDFVEKLLERMNIEDLAIKNNAGDTAFFPAIMSGEIEIVMAFMNKNEDLAKNRGNNDMLPLHMAALFGKRNIVQYLYEATGDELLDKHHDRIELLVSLINCGLYDVALGLVKKHPELATARDKSEETALHSLARMCILKKKYANIDLATLEKKDPAYLDRELPVIIEEIPSSALELFKCLWKRVMLLDDLTISEIIRKPWPLIFVAAKQGNLAFLRIIFSAYPDMIFEVDENHYSIFHFAVLYRHNKIFKLIDEIGSFKDLLVRKTDKEGNNILHLAARLPALDRPYIESAPAIELQQEMLWFKEVRKILHPLDAEAINKDGKTARSIFTEQHQKLKIKAEQWIKDTVISCIMTATIIATVVFAAAFTVPGGTVQETGTPHFVQKASFIIFATSDALALCLSSFSILTFLSVISSRYAEEDFIWLLPHKLTNGLLSLALSILAMMVVFCAAVFIVFKEGKILVPILVTVLSVITVFFSMRKHMTLQAVLGFSKRNRSLFKYSPQDSLFQDSPLKMGKKLYVLNNLGSSFSVK